MKTAQLQIRLTPAQKRLLRGEAARAGQSISDYVLSRVVPSPKLAFSDLFESLSQEGRERFVLASLHDLLASLPASAFATTVETPPPADLPLLIRNQVAAMVEHAAMRIGAPAPAWAVEIPPLAAPWFASELLSLRAHLLQASPTAFRRRNLFVDATIGDRV